MANQSDIEAFLAREFPQNKCRVETVAPRAATVVHPVGVAELRPGGTVSGPVLMTVADVAMYVAVLGTIGIVPLAVTTSLTMNFLRKPSARQPVRGACTLIKVGRSLAVGEVALYSGDEIDMVAHAVVTYALPRTP